MPYDSTAEFVAALEAAGDLKRVSAEADPVLEITEIADRQIKSGGPALLFERVKGHDVPLLINALGSQKRMCLALGVSSYEDIAARIRQLLNLEMPPTLMEKLKRLPPLMKLASIGPDRAGWTSARSVFRRVISTPWRTARPACSWSRSTTSSIASSTRRTSSSCASCPSDAVSILS